MTGIVVARKHDELETRIQWPLCTERVVQVWRCRAVHACPWGVFAIESEMCWRCGVCFLTSLDHPHADY